MSSFIKSRTLKMLVAVSTLIPALAMGSQATAATAAPPFQLNVGWAPGWSYNRFAPNFMNFGPLTNLPLAYPIHPKMNFVPELASSWQVTSSRITVNLRAGAKWQNGQPVTSRDVMDTLEIGAAFGWTVLNGVAGMSAPNSHQVVFELTKGTVPSQVLQNILEQSLVSAGEYGKFVTPSLLHDALVSSNATPTATLPASVSKALTNVKAAVLKFNPKEYVGNGPFELTSMTTNQADLSRFGGFFGGKSIHVAEIVAYNALTGAQGWAEMSAGKTDFGWQGSPKNIKDLWLSNPQHHMALPWDWSQYTFYFNDRRYPLNMVKVRQAIAYVLNRPLLNLIGNGYMRNRPVRTITGIQYAVRNTWMPRSDLKGFHLYAHNPAKAATLLKSAGFQQKGGQWIMPNGKPFTLSLSAPAGWSGPTLSTEAAANELTQFGIKSSATAVEQPGFWVQQSKGQYDISWGWGGWWVFNPLQTFYDDLVNQNFTPNQPGYVGMGFGPAVQVPGIGHVNLADNLTADLKITSPARIRQLSLDYARLVNEQLPFLPYGDKRLTVWYSSQNYTDWPSPNSYLWNQVGGNAPGALALMLMNGYIRPR